MGFFCLFLFPIFHCMWWCERFLCLKYFIALHHKFFMTKVYNVKEWKLGGTWLFMLRGKIFQVDSKEWKFFVLCRNVSSFENADSLENNHRQTLIFQSWFWVEKCTFIIVDYLFLVWLWTIHRYTQKSLQRM